MGKILVTGASGHLGSKTLEQLLKKVPAAQLVGLARDTSKGRAAALAAKGVEIRKGDYFDYVSLLDAFKDVEKVMLIATHGFTDRNTQHFNVIAAAKQAGVKRIVMTSIMRKEGSDFILPEGTVTDIFCEQAVKASGLAWTVLQHPAFFEMMPFHIGERALEVGVRLPAGGPGK